MGFIDKMKNKIDETVGKGKESAGKATDDRHLEYEGKGDQTSANLKQSGEHAKDSFGKATDAFKP
jgi:uncharacterized protein YjbJ (UPF0337 family)